MGAPSLAKVPIEQPLVQEVAAGRERNAQQPLQVAL